MSNKRFTPTRLTQGYDMGEVDQFLDEVESELARLLRENADLRDKAAGLPSTAGDASSAATRLLELATRSADELVGEARAEAERIVGEARTSSERLEAESRGRAEQLESDARTQSEQLEAETAERRRRLFSDLDSERESLEGEVENLRSFEREYRARLKTYFEQQLSALDGSGEGGLLTDGPPA